MSALVGSALVSSALVGSALVALVVVLVVLGLLVGLAGAVASATTSFHLCGCVMICVIFSHSYTFIKENN